ncbi:MAG TPA: ADP-ribosylglycohydrolase family protein [Actinomycetota bacterium]|nr:ADP-ribosylglycohydrolase family protein [Actinomycetota bacterium]
MSALRDRVVGTVLGLALGDALGAPFEFRRAHDVPDPLPAFERPWMGLPPGSTTDDTAMAMNLVRSLAEHGALDSDDLAARHLTWFESNPPDVGNLTRRVMARAVGGVDMAGAARQVWEERGPEVSAGNGSVMYCAPLGAAYANRRAGLLEAAPALSAITHFDERCRTAVLAVTLAVAALVRGESPTAALEDAIGTTIDREGGEELEFLLGAAGVVRPLDGPDQGFVLFAAGLGLQALHRVSGLEAIPPVTVEGELRRVVAFGGDADTNAAVAGALLGAAAGAEGLPRSWLGRLQGRMEIEAEAERLVPVAGRTD